MRRTYLLTALTVALAVLAAWLRIVNLNNVNSRTPDERVYTYQAQSWLTSGKAGMGALIAEYKTDPDMKLYPPPTRVGMIRLTATVMSMTGKRDEAQGALISCAASLASVGLVALIGLRFLEPWAAAAGTLFYAVFPGALATARRTWTDALIELAGLLLVWMMCEVVRGSTGRRWLMAMAGVGAAALAVKESVPVLYVLCGVPVLVTLLRARRFHDATLFVGASIAAFGCVLVWLGAQVGDLKTYLTIVMGIPAANAANQYALDYASGPRYLLLEAFWIAAPVTCLFALSGLWAAFRAKAGTCAAWVAGFTVAYIAMAVSMPHWINLRYVGNTFGPVCLLAGLGCVYVVRTGVSWIASNEGRALALVVAGVVLGGSVADYLRFRRYFIRDEIMDLSIKLLVDEHNQ